MSLSSALSNAVSGLGAASRSAQVVSSNIANALTEGYGRREIALGSRAMGGVGVEGVLRRTDPATLAGRRQAEAGHQGDSTRADALARLAAPIGPADAPDSLPARVTRLESALIEAASAPHGNVRLEAISREAAGLALALNRASETVQAERLRADTAIGRAVEALNTDLSRVETLNAEIARLSVLGQDTAGLMDQRQVVIDRINTEVPVRLLPRQNGMVALTTQSGRIMLDGGAREFAFSPANAMAAGATIDNGLLSGLSLDGRALETGAGGDLGSGRLAAQFALRDSDGPAAQAGLDSFAADLMARFAAPGPDDTLAAGQPGQFTDNGAAYDPANMTGLSGRIALNAALDPDAGGEPWRWRDGLGAAAPGPAGDATRLLAAADALAARQVPADATLTATASSAAGLAGTLLAQADAAQARAEENAAFSGARGAEMRRAELAGGVDTDTEMQNLLLIERAYGANARVVQVVDEMLRRLMEI